MLKSARLHFAVCSAFFVTLFTFSGTALADVVVLEGGKRLTGTITTLEEETLTLTTDYSEPIKILKSKVKSISTDAPVAVHLTGGDILKGRLTGGDKGAFLVEPSAGREAAVLNWDDVATINPAPPVLSEWKGNITVGAGLQSGNTDRFDASVGAEATRKSATDRYNLRLLFNYAEENDSLTTRNTFGALKYDYFFTPVFYGYLGIEMLNDKFKNLSLRTVVGPGAGYQIWDDKKRALALEAGLSYFSENLIVGEDSSWITARLAGTFRYQVMKLISFSDHLVVYPSIEEFGEHQLRNEAVLSSDIGSSLALNFKNILERDSDPAPGILKNDLQWILGLKYSF